MESRVVDNPEKHRYELWLDAERVGFAQYAPKGDRIVFVHTEVEPAHEGKGLGGELARAALDDARKQGTPIVPLCPFIAAFIRKNPQYLELVAPELRPQLSEIDEA